MMKYGRRQQSASASFQPPQAQQLTLFGKLELEGTIYAFVGQKRAQMMRRQADPRAIAASDQDAIRMALVYRFHSFGG